jgi:hypothetical protein
MFIRRSPTRNKATGESYFTFRLVRSERSGGKVRQLTLLNLGRHFPVAKPDWPLLCGRIDQLISGQASLLPVALPDSLERLAQRYAAQRVTRAKTAAAGTGEVPAAERPAVAVEVDSLELVRPRSVGVEHVGLWALATLGVLERLAELGLNGVRRAAVIGTLIGRMAMPGSERATWQWRCQTSALGELLDVDFEGLSLMRLYRASDQLLRHREAIETHLCGRVRDLFGLDETITRYDLTHILRLRSGQALLRRCGGRAAPSAAGTLQGEAQ